MNSSTLFKRVGLMVGLWGILAAAAGCCKSRDSSGAPEAPPSSSTTASGVKLPKGYEETPDEAGLAAAASWAREKPARVDAIPGLRLPGGGEANPTALGKVTVYLCQYSGVSIDKALYGWLTLLAEDGWEISSFKRDKGRPTFRIRKGERMYSAIAGAPEGGEQSQANLSVLYGEGGAGLTPPQPAAVGMKVRTEWPRDHRTYLGELTKVYGRYGFVVYPHGPGGWFALDEMEPPLENEKLPADKDCDVRMGQDVNAPYSTNRKKTYRGKVAAIYMQLVFIKFNDGDQGWAECGEIKK